MAKVKLDDPRSREVPLDFTREWVEFTDPADSEHRIRADLTWLCSRWTCIYGRGCHGIIKKRPHDGCCSHGAFFTDKADERLTRRAAAELTREGWQYYDEARTRTKKGKASAKLDIAEQDSVGDDEDRLRTRKIDGACIFLNRPGWPTGDGCALHQLAMQTGRAITETKPEVCWQLPLRREQEWVARPDETQVLVSTVTEFDRRGWGEGGHDLDWYCSGAPEAHVGLEPVYVSGRDEIVGLIGQPAYDVLADLAAERLAHGLVAEHPATVAARETGAH